MWLADYNLARCKKCNRLMEKKDGISLCSRCAETTAEQLTSTPTTSNTEEKREPKPITPPFVQIESIKEEEQIREIKTCSLCGHFPTLPRREYCLHCLSKLYTSLNSVKEEITTIQRPTKTITVQEVQRSIHSLREIEPFRRVPTSGITWVKRYTYR